MGVADGWVRVSLVLVSVNSVKRDLIHGQKRPNKCVGGCNVCLKV